MSLVHRAPSAALPLQIYLIRHGETACSRTGRYTGHSEVPLTEQGEQMALAVAQHLATVPFARVWVSPRLRARQTCEAAGLLHRAEIVPNLAEWHYGDYEGRRSAEIRQEHPDWDVWRDGCPGGESPSDVCARADRLVARLSALAGPVALFSHGQFGRVLAARWIGQAAQLGQPLTMDPATICTLGRDPARPGRHVILSWNVAAS